MKHNGPAQIATSKYDAALALVAKQSFLLQLQNDQPPAYFHASQMQEMETCSGQSSNSSLKDDLELSRFGTSGVQRLSLRGDYFDADRVCGGR